MWLQLMWLQFEVVRGPVGVVWGRLGERPDQPIVECGIHVELTFNFVDFGGPRGTGGAH